ncbi:MAG: PEP-utilizing enzyme [Anaerolineae bacterium]|jgi:phosphohistidine swiveling domain-containing protein
MTEWLLSGHNTRESVTVARPVTVTHTEDALDDQINWFLRQLAGDEADFDHTLKPTAVVQGRLYLNINYFARNMGTVMPFDPESVGVPADKVPADLLEETPPVPRGQQLRLPLRFRRTYRWAADFYRRLLPELSHTLGDLYWKLHEVPHDPLPLVWSLFDPQFQGQLEDINRAHIVVTLTITTLDGILRQRVPALLSLFAGQATATSLIGERIWELRQTVEKCGPEVRRMLAEGVAELDAYQALPEATPLVAGVRAFLHEYGHRGFRHEADWATERLTDRPEHILLAVAGQLSESESPEVRAEAARQAALEGLRRMNPVRRLFWRRFLRWGQQLIAWREDSKSNLALRQAAYGLAARHLGRRFYPDHPDDVMMFYKLGELLTFVRSRGEQRVGQDTLARRRAQFELYRTQPPPPELIWYDPLTRHWRPALEEKEVIAAAQFQGIAASAGSGPTEGIAVVTNDPLDAGRRLLELEGPVVLVTRLTDPAWSSLFRRLSAVITELGGVISHAAIIARENGLPAVVGIPEATRRVRDGQRLRVDGAAGTVEVLN